MKVLIIYIADTFNDRWCRYFTHILPNYILMYFQAQIRETANVILHNSCKSTLSMFSMINFCLLYHAIFLIGRLLHYVIDNIRARVKGCLNAEYPDQYGHYREADYTMTKHHWWWKVNLTTLQFLITHL